MKLVNRNDVARLLPQINSMTKYPSILTYHQMGERGVLSPAIQVPLEGHKLHLTEKVDGTNSRIIVLPHRMGWIIGSREDLLGHSHDLIHNPAMGIVDTLREVAPLIPCQDAEGGITVVYLEVYGGNVGTHAKQYASDRSKFGYRAFDIAVIPGKEIEGLDEDLPHISYWREHTSKPFLPRQEMLQRCREWKIPAVPHVEVDRPIPLSVADTHEWLKAALAQSKCKLDEQAGGKPEGLVVRSEDRAVIAKVRFEDYERSERASAGKR